MPNTRRDFLKVSTLGGAALTLFGFDLAPAYAQLRELKIARATETRSTCPYCSVSCGVIIYTLGDKAKNVTPQVIHVEGDPDHPINRGTLCPKGSSLEQDILNPRRLTKPQVRRPGGTDWEDISWDDAINEIGRSDKEDSRPHISSKRTRRGQHRQPLRGYGLDRRLYRHQRIQLSRREDDAQPGGLLPGKPGQSLTRPHGLKFGTNIRTRGDDQWLDRHQEHRHDVDHGRETRRRTTPAGSSGPSKQSEIATPR